MDAMIERLRREKAEVEAKNKHAAQEQGSKNNADFSAGRRLVLNGPRMPHTWSSPCIIKGAYRKRKVFVKAPSVETL